MNRRLALELRGGGSGSIPVAELARRCGLSPEAVAAQLAEAEAEAPATPGGGAWRFERGPAGVRLLEAPPQLDADELAHELGVRVIGRSVRVVRFTESTNDLARDALAAGVPQGQAVFAEQQTAGRGRMGRAWSAPRYSSLLLSVHLAPDPARLPPDRYALVGLAAALAVADTVAAATGAEPSIRWPNDVLVGGAKIAGLLLESAGPLGCVVGIGLNVNQKAEDFGPGLRTPAVSAAMLAGGPVDRTLTARRLLAELDRRYAALHNGDGGQADVRRDWRTRSDLPGRRVSLTCSGRRLTGRVIDLTEDGGLLFHPDAGPPTVLRPETVSDVRAASSG